MRRHAVILRLATALAAPIACPALAQAQPAAPASAPGGMAWPLPGQDHQFWTTLMVWDQTLLT